MGINNELFQTERDETPSCQFATVPNDVTNPDGQTLAGMLSAIERFALFMRFLAPPTPSPDTPGGTTSIGNGRTLFTSVGCALCHTPTLQTGNATVAALRRQAVNLYSDLLLHDMGPGLADGISQGQAGPSEFRTAPLWAWDSASSSFTTAGRRISSRRSRPIRAAGRPRTAPRRRRTASSSSSTRSRRIRNRTS